MHNCPTLIHTYKLFRKHSQLHFIALPFYLQPCVDIIAQHNIYLCGSQIQALNHHLYWALQPNLMGKCSVSQIVIFI